MPLENGTEAGAPEETGPSARARRMQHKSMPDITGQFTGREALKFVQVDSNCLYKSAKPSYENDQRLAPKPFTE